MEKCQLLLLYAIRKTQYADVQLMITFAHAQENIPFHFTDNAGIVPAQHCNDHCISICAGTGNTIDDTTLL